MTNPGFNICFDLIATGHDREGIEGSDTRLTRIGHLAYTVIGGFSKKRSTLTLPGPPSQATLAQYYFTVSECAAGHSSCVGRVQ